MEERLKMLLRELEAEEGKGVEERPVERPSDPPDFRVEIPVFEGLLNIHRSTYILVRTIDDIITSLRLIRGGRGYVYEITCDYYGNIRINWWGDRTRLPEVERVARRIVEALRDNLWEEYAHLRVMAELKAIAKEEEEKYRAEIDEIYRQYERRPPKDVIYDPEGDQFIVKVTAGSEGWYIGKQGAVIKPLEEKIGKRIRIVGIP